MMNDSMDQGTGTADATQSSSASPGQEIDVQNAMRVVRPQLGDDAGVALYRLFRLVALEDIMGHGADGISYFAGKKLGGTLGLTDLDAFLELCSALKIGVIDVPVLTESKARVDIYECVTCAGMETVGRPVCHFEAGLVAGVLGSIFDKRTQAKEVTCIGGLGHDACGIDVAIG